MADSTRPSPQAPLLAGHTHPGLDIEFNHDLNVSGGFLQSYAPIQEALRDERLLEEFKHYESKTASHKRMFHRLGVGSLLLGLLTLASAAFAVIAGQSLVRIIGPAWIIATLPRACAEHKESPKDNYGRWPYFSRPGSL